MGWEHVIQVYAKSENKQGLKRVQCFPIGNGNELEHCYIDDAIDGILMF